MCEQVIFNDIKDILKTFEYFIKNYENELKLKTTVEEIKDHFKAANFIEKTIIKMQEKELLEKFMTVLNSYLRKANRNVTYDTTFYTFACDKILIKYLQSRKFDVEIALRMYTSFCDEKRLENALEKIILNSGINESVLNYIISNKENLNTQEIEARIMLANFIKQINSGKLDETKKTIGNLFDSYKIDVYLPTFIGILCLENSAQEEILIKRTILQVLLSKMEDRSYLSKEFWITLLKNTEKDLIILTCKKYKLFLTSLLSFLVYCGSMMSYSTNNLERQWYGNPNKSICPEISFEDILIILKLLIALKGEIAEYTKNYIVDAKNNTNSLFWVDITRLIL